MSTSFTNLEWRSEVRESGNGGAIDFWEGAVAVISHCRFVECQMRAGNPPQDGYGGAIYISRNNPELTCQFCVFENCYAETGGGAINLDFAKKVAIETCSFTRCQTDGDRGGGVLRVNEGDTAFTFTGCTITDCSGRGPGSPGTLIKVASINEMQFSGNTIERTTGSYTGTTISLGFVDGYGKLTISSCRFSNHNANPMLSITGPTFPGGAVFEDCNFTDNQFQGDQGIANVQAATSTYDNCQFRDNEVKGEDGQAIIVLRSATTTFDTCLFENCITTANSGIVKGSEVSTTTLGFNNCDFIRCKGGNGVVRNGLAVTTLKFTLCFFRDFGTSDGGAVLQTRSATAVNILMEECNFTNCYKDGTITNAALLDISPQESGTLEIQHVKFEWNEVCIASIQKAKSVNFSNCEFVAGSVQAGSNAIHLAACDSFFALELCGFMGIKTGSEFVLTAASVPNVSVTNCTFQDCDAKLMSVESTEKITLERSQFVFKVAENVNPISLESPATEVDACDFVVGEGEEQDWNTHLLVYSGTSITLSDCCFSYGEAFENSTIQFRYMALRGNGTATLSGVCFEGEERFAISRGEGPFTVNKDETTAFEGCTCSLPPPPSYPPSPTDIPSSHETESAGDTDKPNNTVLIVGIVLGLLILVVIVVVLILIFVIRRKKLDNTSESGKEVVDEEPATTTGADSTTVESVADTWSATTDTNMFVTHNLDIQPLEMGFEEMLD